MLLKDTKTTLKGLVNTLSKHRNFGAKVTRARAMMPRQMVKSELCSAQDLVTNGEAKMHKHLRKIMVHTEDNFYYANNDIVRHHRRAAAEARKRATYACSSDKRWEVNNIPPAPIPLRYSNQFQEEAEQRFKDIQELCVKT